MTIGNYDYGDPEHARAITQGRHSGVQDAMQWLAFTHLPKPVRVYSEPFYTAAVALIDAVATDSAELTTALNTLITAKDHGMRAGIRASTGRAGSIPRPQEIVDPPVFGSNTGHGHVRARPDGLKARCGGPGLCSVCSAELGIIPRS